jgi:hypothetical protein
VGARPGGEDALGDRPDGDAHRWRVLLGGIGDRLSDVFGGADCAAKVADLLERSWSSGAGPRPMPGHPPGEIISDRPAPANE